MGNLQGKRSFTFPEEVPVTWGGSPLHKAADFPWFNRMVVAGALCPPRRRKQLPKLCFWGG